MDKTIKETKYKGFCVTEDGKVIGKRGNELVGVVDKCGYKQVCLYIGNRKQKSLLVHRLIMETFNPVEGMDELDVNHKNGIKTDNSLKNLEWVTRSENIKHSYKNRLQTTVSNQYGSFKTPTEQEINLMSDLFLEGLNYTEIGKVVGFSRHTVKKYLMRQGLIDKKEENKDGN